MADLEPDDLPEPAYEYYRLIGDVPYLLIEFRPEAEEVSIEISVHGIAAEQTLSGIRLALNEVLDALN